MKGAKRVARVFRPLDTSAADEVLDRYAASQKQVAVHARALRMDINCGDICETLKAVKTLTSNVSKNAMMTLRELFHPVQETPADMQAMLDKLD
ncbi:MAG TPA: hypothetical protein VGR19_08715 [Allosphingosinicella sp.]|nr:hypothetical protein [Allosphingosinicella sp.]